jgi:hypothetical protein
MYNVGPLYLSIGEQVEPTIYFFFTFVYAVVLFLWVYGYLRGSDGYDGNNKQRQVSSCCCCCCCCTQCNKHILHYSKRVFNIHYLMTVLLVLKLLSVLFHGVCAHSLSLLTTIEV